MNQSVYVVMINDRHTDPEPEVFLNRDEAIEFAQKYVREYGRPGDVEVHDPPPMGWLFYGTYSVEADCVWVLEKTLR